jgi:tetratricopeptide (TPR) repeat protein
MPQLNAFVGHSFNKEDDSVVRALLRLLGSVKNVMPEFDWDHAEAAEPKVLSVKVREKMKGKNLFIGICTGREQGVPAVKRPGPIASWFVPNTQLMADRATIETKTSDWILQEIGFALGSNMDVIILLEEGVRRPGGLQGDLEYIPFTRAEPEKCFEKLSSMLGSLSPRPTPAAEASEKPATGESTVVPLGDLFIDNHLTPDPSWAADTYVTRFGFSIIMDKPTLQKRISEAFRSSPFYQEEGSRVAFEAAGISRRAIMYKEDWINPLNKLVEEYPTQLGPYLALAERFAATEEHERAAQNFELASERAKPIPQKIQLLMEAGSQWAKAKQPEVAERLLIGASELLRNSPSHQADGLAQMAGVWKELGRTELFLACAERCLELAPDRTEPRFALAFRYGELHMDAEALFHYRQYLLAKEDPAAWNNLGVVATALKLPVTAVDGYLRADDEGNTLATSNLAFEKLEAGFVDEAIELCNRGLKTEDPNSRLLDALAKCKRAREEESEKESAVLDATKMRREVLRAMGKVSLQATPDGLSSVWKGPNCQLSAVFEGSRVVMRGTYERKAGTLSGLMAGLLAGDRNETVTVEYVGNLYGGAFVGKVKASTPSALTSALSLLDSEGRDCIGYLDSNGVELVILEGKGRYVLSALG